MKAWDQITDFLLDYCKQWLTKNWQKPFGVIAFTSVVSLPLFLGYEKIAEKYAYYFEAYFTSNQLLSHLLAFFLIYFLVFLYIFQKVKYPVTPKNKIGIYIAITNKYKDSESNILINKIHKETEGVLADSGFGDIFNIVSLDEYKSQRILKEQGKSWCQTKSKISWRVNMSKTRWRFIIYGSVKKSVSKGADVYKLELDYVVKHGLINDLQSQNLGKEWKSFLLTQPWEFPVAEELRSLEIISENIRENMLFALGSSMYVSGYLNDARIYHEKLFYFIQPRASQEVYLQTLLRRTKELLTRENNIIGNYYFQKLGDIDNAIAFQERALSFSPDLYDAHLNLAHHYYLKGAAYKNNIDYHLSKASEHPKNSAFKLSQGFIKIDLDTDYENGLILYDDTLRKGFIPSDIVDTTLDFMREQQKIHQKPYLFFLEALIVYHKKDNERGKQMLKEFIEKNKDDRKMLCFTNKAKKITGLLRA